MELLKLENGIVVMDSEGESLPCVQAIKRQDRSEKLLNFQNIITGIYFIYKPDGIYENLSEKERKIVIFEKGHITKEWSNYENNKNVNELIDVYVKIVKTPARKFLDKIKEDMDNYLEYLQNIPMEVSYKIDRDITFEHEGVEYTKRIQVREKKENMDAKNKAYASAIKISEMYEKQRQVVMKEVLDEKAKKARKRTFDKKGRDIPHNV